jgi:phospholipid/cholesterol/gamma-HCH transport system permease protein
VSRAIRPATVTAASELPEGARKGLNLLRLLAFLGSLILNAAASVRVAVEEIGRTIILLARTLVWLFRRPFRAHEVFRQLDFVGVQSLELICITGAFTGMVMALQSHLGMSKFGAVSLLGGAVALTLARELGPVLSALMVCGRAGSAIAAELGSMRTTEQIDALSSMAVEPVQYLVLPRLLAATIAMPLLAILFEFCGMVGAYLTAVYQLGMEGPVFMNSVQEYLELEDITHGLIKSVVFGLIVSLVSCAKGFHVTGGARGVGQATTRAVVISSLLILASDYAMTAIMFGRPA